MELSGGKQLRNHTYRRFAAELKETGAIKTAINMQHT